mgnify:CR=1 FL=1
MKQVEQEQWDWHKYGADCEREHCARIAENYTKEHGSHTPECGCRECKVGESIAYLIRKRGEDNVHTQAAD